MKITRGRSSQHLGRLTAAYVYTHTKQFSLRMSREVYYVHNISETDIAGNFLSGTKSLLQIYL